MVVECVLATKQARGLFVQLQNKIKKYALHKDTFELIKQWSPCYEYNEIVRRRRIKETLSQEQIQLLNTYFTSAYSFKEIPDSKINTIAIACGDVQTYKEVKKELGNFVTVSLTERDQDLLDLLSYEQVRVIPGDSKALTTNIEQAENVTIFSHGQTLDEVFPERYVIALEEQSESLYALHQLQPLLSIDIPSSKTATTNEAITKEIVQNALESTCKDLQNMLDEILSHEQFSGAVFSDIMQGKTTLLKQLPDYLREQIRIEQKKACDNLESRFAHSFANSIIITDMGKVDLDLNAFEQDFKIAIHQFQEHKRQSRSRLSSQAKSFIKQLGIIKSRLLHLDLYQSLQQFELDNDLTPAQIVGEGIEFVYGRNLNLENAVPVAYHLGGESPLAVLTGANSGGKTTLLELLAQIQLLTQMGLGVPAKEAKVGLVSQIYYFSKSKGTLGAGAFETMLSQFAKLSHEKEQSKLILADEIESVTEPDVAAKIIKGIIIQLQQHHKTSVLLVTHVGRELQKLSCPARFDGIEAKGLAADFSLVVDRNPMIGKIARSTPQLIIERLAKIKSDNFYKELYKHISG